MTTIATRAIVTNSRCHSRFKRSASTPLCGDEVIVYLLEQDDVTKEVTTEGRGYSISQSAASMMSTAVKDRTVSQARQLTTAFKQMMPIHNTDIGGPSHTSIGGHLP